MKPRPSTLLALLLSSLFFAAVLCVARAPVGSPEWLGWLRPLWLHLWVALWVLALPTQIGVFWASVVGLLADVLLGMPLGLNMATAAVVAYVCLRFGPVLRASGLVQQAFMLVPLFMGVAVLQGVVLLAMQGAPFGFLSALAGISTACAWPLVNVLLGGRRLTAEPSR